MQSPRGGERKSSVALQRTQSGFMSNHGSKKPQKRKDVSDVDLNTYHRLFSTFDVDDSGYLEFGELQLLLCCLGMKISDEQLEKMKDEFDDDGNGTLDFEEFVNFMLRSGELADLRITSEEEEREHIRMGASKRFLPDTLFRWVWDLLILLVTAYFTLRVPVEIWKPWPIHPGMIALEIALTVALIVDIGIQLNTAQVDSTGKVILDPKEIAEKYLKAGLVPDVLGALPIDLCLVAAYGFDHHTAIAYRICRPLRLLRIFRVFFSLFEGVSVTGLLTPLFVSLHFAYSPVIKAVFYFVTFVHFLTIGWLIVVDNSNYAEHERHQTNYVDGIYLVLYTLTTVGYGDIQISGTGQRLYCSGLFLAGAMVNGIVISQMSVFLQKANIDSERKDKMRETLAVLEHFDIPNPVQEEILSFQQHILEHNLGSSHEALVSALPDSIQESLALFMKIKYISMVPMFISASHDCKVALANSLLNIVFRPQEFIIIAGETGREMYFLGHGIADVIHPKGFYLATLRKGNFFGEIALLIDGAPRTASIKALTYCDVFRLERVDFASILMKFPAFRESVQVEIDDRIEKFKAQQAAQTAIVPKRRKDAEIEEQNKTVDTEGETPQVVTQSDSNMGHSLTEVPSTVMASSALRERASSPKAGMARKQSSNTGLGSGTLQQFAEGEGNPERPPIVRRTDTMRSDASNAFGPRMTTFYTSDSGGGRPGRERKKVVVDEKNSFGIRIGEDMKKTIHEVGGLTTRVNQANPDDIRQRLSTPGQSVRGRNGGMASGNTGAPSPRNHRGMPNNTFNSFSMLPPSRERYRASDDMAASGRGSFRGSRHGSRQGSFVTEMLNEMESGAFDAFHVDHQIGDEASNDVSPQTSGIPRGSPRTRDLQEKIKQLERELATERERAARASNVASKDPLGATGDESGGGGAELHVPDLNLVPPSHAGSNASSRRSSLGATVAPGGECE